MICVPLSAKTGEGVNNLLENIQLVAEVQELQANPTAWPRAQSSRPNWTKAAAPWLPSWSRTAP